MHPISLFPTNPIIYQSITVEPLPTIKVFSTLVLIESFDPFYLNIMSRKDAIQWIKVIKEEIANTIQN